MGDWHDEVCFGDTPLTLTYIAKLEAKNELLRGKVEAWERYEPHFRPYTHAEEGSPCDDCEWYAPDTDQGPCTTDDPREQPDDCPRAEEGSGNEEEGG